MDLKVIRSLIRFLLRMLAQIEVCGRENIPVKGNFIIASNHLGLVDVLLPFFIIDNNNLVVLVGEKWEKSAVYRWLGKRLNFIFVDRFNPDLKAIRLVLSRMKQGEVLVITPEGTRSKVGYLIEGRPGVSYLAAKLRIPILPAGISGSFDPVFFGHLKRFRKPNVAVNVGKPFTLPPLSFHERDQDLQRFTDEIMCRIAALLPEEYRGFYTKHPRLIEILSHSGESS